MHEHHALCSTFRHLQRRSSFQATCCPSAKFWRASLLRTGHVHMQASSDSVQNWLASVAQDMKTSHCKGYHYHHRSLTENVCACVRALTCLPHPPHIQVPRDGARVRARTTDADHTRSSQAEKRNYNSQVCLRRDLLISERASAPAFCHYCSGYQFLRSCVPVPTTWSTSRVSRA